MAQKGGTSHLSGQSSTLDLKSQRQKLFEEIGPKALRSPGKRALISAKLNHANVSFEFIPCCHQSTFGGHHIVSNVEARISGREAEDWGGSSKASSKKRGWRLEVKSYYLHLPSMTTVVGPRIRKADFIPGPELAGNTNHIIAPESSFLSLKPAKVVLSSGGKHNTVASDRSNVPLLEFEENPLFFFPSSITNLSCNSCG